MALSRSPFATVALVLAGSAMLAMPATAAEVPAGPRIPPIAYEHPVTTQVDSAYGYRHRPRWHRNRVDAGDVIAGVAVIGVLAAIAGSASSNRERDVCRERPEPYRDPYREPAPQPRGWQGGGIDSAVDMCVGEIERGQDRVASVDEAARDSSGWRVSGALDSGEGFACRIDNEGRLRALDIGNGFARLEGLAAEEGAQLSDAAYARARAAQRGIADTPVDADLAPPPSADGPQPAYPGGPLPGEEGYAESWGSEA